VKDAIGQVLSLGLGVALSPVPIIAVVLMLATPRGRVNGPAFLVGWVAGLAVVGTVVLLASSGADASDDGEPATWVAWVKMGLGALLLLVALHQWRGRPAATEEAQLPAWMQTINRFTPWRSAGMAALLAGINPKNLLLILGAGAAIAQTGASAGSQAVGLAVFVALGTLGPGIPVGIYFTMGERAPDLLNRLKGWLALHNTAIMAVLCGVIGLKLLGDGISAV
jgi:threonine/homoserine/homoserine lactone efflux protein